MERIKGMLYLTGAFVLAGTSVVAARFVSESLGTFTIAAASLLFGLAALLPVCFSRLLQTLKRMNGRDWLPLLLQALTGMFLFRLFLLKGLNLTSAGEAGILTGATPAITVLLAAVFLRESLNKIRMAGLLATISGILLLQGVVLQGSGFVAGHMAGNMLVLCAASCESSFNVLSRSNLAGAGDSNKTTDPLVQTALVSIIAFILCLGPSVTEDPLRRLAGLDAGQWLALVWYGVIVTALAYIFWYAGIKRSEASVAAVFSGMMPLTALLLSVALLGERPSLQQYLGGMTVVLGMVVSGLGQAFRSTAAMALQKVDL